MAHNPFVPDFHPETWSPQDGPWTVVLAPPDNGFVRAKDRVCSVPFPYTIVQEHIRLHEAHHVLLDSGIGGWTKLDAMVEENIVDAIAFDGGLDVNRRHDLFPEPEMPMGTAEAAMEWYLQFAPTVADRAALVGGAFVYDFAVAKKHLIQHHQVARRFLVGEKVDVNAIDAIVVKIWQDPSRATAAWASAELAKLLPDVPPPSPTASPPSPGAERMAWPPAQGVGTRREATMPKDCGARVEIAIATEQSDGSYKIDEQASKFVTEAADRTAAGKAEVMEAGLRQAWQLARRKRDEGARDRALLDKTRATLAVVTERTTSNPGFVIDHVVLPANKARQAISPSGDTQRGEEINQITRWWADKAIFTSRRPGGTIIIDCSGSMCWDWNELREAVKKLPSATIAIFDGAHNLTKNGNPVGGGRMIIVAEKGRWCDPTKVILSHAFFTGGNAVDLETLEWLAKQPGPRVWLGDGLIHHGRYGELSSRIGKIAAHNHMRALCRKGRIVRTRSVPAAIEYLSSEGRPGINGILSWNNEGFIPTSAR